MKTASTIYTILMPYIIIAGFWQFLAFGPSKVRFVVFLVIAVLASCAGVASCVACNLFSLHGMTDAQSAARLIIIKLSYIPVHLLMLLCCAGMMNPWLLMASWIPLVIIASLVSYSAFTNIGACIRLFAEKKCTLVKAVVLCLLSFVGVADIVAAIIQINAAKKTGEGFVQ